MEELGQLIKIYGIGDILIFAILIAGSVKGLISFYEWSAERVKKLFNKEYKKKTDQEKLEERLDKNDVAMKQVFENQERITGVVQDLSDKMGTLIDSDKDDIKSFLTREHHYFCYEKGWIDDYSLECCEKRYEHYLAEGGNSFINSFMEELRRLPKVPPPGNDTQIAR